MQDLIAVAAILGLGFATAGLVFLFQNLNKEAIK